MNMNTTEPKSTSELMRPIKTKSGLLIHMYDDARDFLEHNSPSRIPEFQRKYGTGTWRSELDPRRQNERKDWSGNVTHKEAYDLATNGMAIEHDLLEFRDRVTLEAKQIMEQSFAWDVTGEMVDVGAFMTGEPECMLTTVETECRNRKVINILYNAGASCGVSEVVLKYRGIAVMALVDALLSTNRYAVNLYIAACSGSTTGGVQMIHLIHSEHPYDPQESAYFLTHPSFLRRLVFLAWNYLTPQDARKYGVDNGSYGAPWTLKELPPEVDPDGCVVIDSQHLNNYQVTDQKDALRWVQSQVERIEKSTSI